MVLLSLLQFYPGCLLMEADTVHNLLRIAFRLCPVIPVPADLFYGCVASLFKIRIYLELKEYASSVRLIPDPKIQSSQSFLCIGMNAIPSGCEDPVQHSMVIVLAVIIETDGIPQNI